MTCAGGRAAGAVVSTRGVRGCWLLGTATVVDNEGWRLGDCCCCCCRCETVCAAARRCLRAERDPCSIGDRRVASGLPGGLLQVSFPGAVTFPRTPAGLPRTSPLLRARMVSFRRRWRSSSCVDWCMACRNRSTSTEVSRSPASRRAAAASASRNDKGSVRAPYVSASIARHPRTVSLGRGDRGTATPTCMSNAVNVRPPSAPTSAGPEKTAHSGDGSVFTQ